MGDIQKLINEIYWWNDKKFQRSFDFLGQGIARKVYAIDDNYVLKLAKGKNGYYQNMVENYVYTHSERKLKRYLCPIVYFDPKMIIMKRALPLSNRFKKSYIDLNHIRGEKSAKDDLVYLADKYYLFFKDIISTTSWGILENKNVLIDYGCTSEQGDFYYDRLFENKYDRVF